MVSRGRPQKGSAHQAGPRLDGIIDTGHALAKLSTTIDWRALEGRFGHASTEGGGDRPSRARLLVGLAILKQLFDLPDDELCDRWIENPYYQYFCGEQFFRRDFVMGRGAALRGLRRMESDKVRGALRESLAAAVGRSSLKLSEIARLGGAAAQLSKELAAERSERRRPAAAEGPRSASIYDVAKRAGVSIKTVSLVINRQPNVSPQTRAAVLAAIDALSYRPNVFARGLASERSYLIGMLYETPGSYIADLQQGALAMCRQEGYHLIVELLPQEETRLRQRVRALVGESALHGVILTPPLCDSTVLIDELARTQTPMVRIAPGIRMDGHASVGIDERRAAHEMTAYLIGLGHRRIGFIKGHPEHVASHARFEGYRGALSEAGIPFTEEFCAAGMFSYQSGLEAGEQLLGLKNRPTAIFAGNDDMAAGVLAVSQRFNIRIPDQLSLAGFDDSLVAQVVWPRLTTCRQPIREMAAAAVSILVQRERDTVPERQLDHEIVVRESTAPPAP
ncbi:MAG: substrate-binding domain-containing protein [Alphaproteobacteria bacterium]|nr:substrate-binding domain-containing protein [Alphaproteobacteria bacterium]